jgi:hypothetical protein
MQIFAMGPMLLPIALLMALLLGATLVLWRIVKRALGFAPAEAGYYQEGWRPGDQLAYLAGECGDERQGQWPRCEWQGRLSGRGQTGHHAWRCGNCCLPENSWRSRAR